jgi:hypothetical protein
MPELTRITRDPTVMGGKPCIRGIRVTVGTFTGTRLTVSASGVLKIKRFLN